MTNYNNKNSISRKNFLRASGVLTAGYALLPAAAFPGTTGTHSAIGYQIVIPAQASEMEKEAAAQLQRYLSEIAKTTFSVVAENEYKDKAAIFVGNTEYAKLQQIDTASLKMDGYLLKPAADNFIIAGGSGKGIIYGAVGLLEALGCKRYTSAYTYVPATTQITLPKKEIRDVPVIGYRTTSYRDTREPAYTNWHKLSSRENWGLFVHTFDVLVPPAEYGKTHPEYFSLINDSREPGTQLCLSNPDLLNELVKNLRKKIAANPKALYWSVSQNDNDQYCQCASCKSLNEKYGGVPSGSILEFVNKVAAQLPDKIISTLAYWYSRSAPKNIHAESNVNIMLCNIESKRHGPVFETDPAFSADLKDWGKLTNNILIWDYNIQFTNLISPFPNLHTIKPNIKFYTENNVNSLFMQSNSQVGGEMANLRAYLICKLMWNPDADDNAIINDFLNGYYGKAATFIRQYIDSMRESLLKSKFELGIFGDPVSAKDTYLSLEMMNSYKRLFDQAEAAVKKDPELLRRVQIARLPIIYAEIQIGQQEVDTARSLYKTAKNGRVVVKPEMVKSLQLFVERCNAEGVTRLRERSTPPNDYLASYNRVFDRMKEMDKSLSLNKKITPVTMPVTKEAGVLRLTDGLFGSYESWSGPDAHWVGYEGEHMDFVLDLGESKNLNTVNMDFLNAQAQPDWNLLVLPRFVTYALSVDGEKYDDPIKIENPHSPNPQENANIAKIPFQSFKADLKSSKARYIKVHAESWLKLPAWHIRTGKAALIYTDGIIVT